MLSRKKLYATDPWHRAFSFYIPISESLLPMRYSGSTSHWPVRIRLGSVMPLSSQNRSMGSSVP